MTYLVHATPTHPVSAVLRLAAEKIWLRGGMGDRTGADAIQLAWAASGNLNYDQRTTAEIAYNDLFDLYRLYPIDHLILNLLLTADILDSDHADRMAQKMARLAMGYGMNPKPWADGRQTALRRIAAVHAMAAIVSKIPVTDYVRMDSDARSKFHRVAIGAVGYADALLKELAK